MTAPARLDIDTAAARAGLIIPTSVCDQVAAALDAGHHVALTGGAGVGKTSFALAIADAARDAMRCTGYLPTTASVDWTPGDVVGDHVPGPSGPVFRPGLFLEAIEAARWVVVDELERLDPARSLGALSTVLSGHAVVLPFRQPGRAGNIAIVPAGAVAPAGTDVVRVPATWRVVATVNGQRSRVTGAPAGLPNALARRFAFIEIPSPSEQAIRSLVAGKGEMVADLLTLRQELELGPAVFVDAARYAGRRAATAPTKSRVLLEAFAAYLLPQFGTLDRTEGQRILDHLRPLLDREDLIDAATLVARHSFGAVP